MRLGPMLLVAALVVVGCGDADEEPAATGSSTTTAATIDPSTTTTTSAATSTTTTVVIDRDPPWATDLPALPVEEVPALLLARDRSVVAIDGGTAREVATVAGRADAALGDPDGVLIVEVEDSLVRVTGDGPSVEVGPEEGKTVRLFDLVGEEILYMFRVDRDGEEPSGELVLRAPGGEERRVANAAAPEFGTGHASAAAGVVLATSTSDLTESMAVWSLDGTAQERWLPTTDLPYNMPPLVTMGELSPDGREMAWLEGPDWDGGRQEIVGEWVLVVAGVDGIERARVPVAPLGTDLSRMEFDGRFAVLSAIEPDGTRHRPLVIDTTTSRAVILDEAGAATFAS